MNPSAIKAELCRRVPGMLNGAILLQGPALSGKSWVLDALGDHLQTQRPEQDYVHHAVCSTTLLGYEPILDAIEALSKRENWARGKRWRRLARSSAGHAAGIAGGILRTFFPDAVPQDLLDKIRGALEDFAKGGTGDSPAAAFPRSETSRVNSALCQVLKKSGRRLVLLVDRVDELSLPGIHLLQMLIDTEPSGLVLVMTANTESIAYQQRADIRELANTCARKGGSRYNVDGYSVDELVAFRKFRGFSTSVEEARRAHEFSGGIVGLLLSWLMHDDNSPAGLESAAEQLAAHKQTQYDRLSPQGKNLVKCLAAIYPAGLDLNQVAQCMGCPIGELEDRVKEVAGTFAELTGRDMVLKDSHVLYFVRTRIAPALVEVAHSDLMRRLGTSLHPEECSVGQTHGETLQLPLSVLNMDAPALLHLVASDLARGASQAAIQRVSAWRDWHAGEAVLSPEIESQLLLLEADAFGQLGAYSESIERLERMRVSGAEDSLQRAVALGEKYLRTGAQTNALQCFLQARRQSRNLDDASAWTKAAARTLTVRNEMRAGRPSIMLLEHLKRLLDSDVAILPQARCLGYRTIARTLALIPERRAEAEIAARRAIQLATDVTRSTRDTGNARYALADVLRHSGQFADAIDEYTRVGRIAESLENYDLRLYSMLGIAACRLSTDDPTHLNEILSTLRDYCRPATAAESNIVGIFDIALQRLRGSAARLVDPALGVPARPWTIALLRHLASDSPIKKLGSTSPLIVL